MNSSIKGGENYDPSTSNVVLKDGQPFYSKQNKRFYIGETDIPISQLIPFVNKEEVDSQIEGSSREIHDVIDAYVTTHNNIKNGTGDYSIEQILSTDGTRYNQADGAYSVALGQQGKAYGRGSISLGNSSKAGYTYEEWLSLKGLVDSEENHTAFLKDADNRYQVVIGQSTKALGKDSFAGGHSTIAKGNMSFAFGTVAGDTNNPIYTEAIGDSSIALGKGVKAVGEHSFAIGETTNASGKRAIAIGLATSSKGENAFAGGYGAVAESKNSLAFGLLSNAKGENSIALGNEAVASAIDSIAIGYKAICAGEQSIALSNGSVSGKYSLVFGPNSYANADDSIMLGRANGSNNPSTVGIGQYNNLNSAKTVAVGFNNTISGQNNIAIGIGLTARNDFGNEILLGQYSKYKWISSNEPVGKRALLTIGNGTSSSNSDRSNALELSQSGNLWVAGKIQSSIAPTENDDVLRWQEKVELESTDSNLQIAISNEVQRATDEEAVIKTDLANKTENGYKYTRQCFVANSYLSLSDAAFASSVEFTAAYNADRASMRFYYIEVLNGYNSIEITYDNITKTLSDLKPYEVFRVECKDAVWEPGGSGQIISYPSITVSRLTETGEYVTEVTYSSLSITDIKLTITDMSTANSIKYRKTAFHTITALQ